MVPGIVVAGQSRSADSEAVGFPARLAAGFPAGLAACGLVSRGWDADGGAAVPASDSTVEAPAAPGDLPAPMVAAVTRAAATATARRHLTAVNIVDLQMARE
jgi:hypothetical protein